MEWQPEIAGLRQLAGYLRDSLSGYDRGKQKEAEQVRPQDTHCGMCLHGRELC